MSAEIISKEPPALDIKLETVTPERAAVLLKGNTHNRSVNANYVQTLAREMTEGRWKVNGDSIRMNGSTLIDGQHRLTACILSGQSFDTLVLTGLESDVFDTIDNGRKRTAGDVLSITGEKNATTMAAALSVVARYKAGAMRRQWAVSTTEIEGLRQEYIGIRESVDLGVNNRANGMISPSMIAALHYLFAEHDPALATDYCLKLIKGIGLEESDPVFKLRARLIQNATAKAKLPRAEIVALIIKAWNSTRQGVRPKTLRWRTAGNAAEAFPVIE